MGLKEQRKDTHNNNIPCVSSSNLADSSWHNSSYHLRDKPSSTLNLPFQPLKLLRQTVSKASVLQVLSHRGILCFVSRSKYSHWQNFVSDIRRCDKPPAQCFRKQPKWNLFLKVLIELRLLKTYYITNIAIWNPGSKNLH